MKLAIQQGNTSEGCGDQLKQAIVAYRMALEERTQVLTPLDWASTQHELGETLQRLGWWSKDPEYLEAAIEAFRMALDVRTPDGHPEDWKSTMKCLGKALSRTAKLTQDWRPQIEAFYINQSISPSASSPALLSEKLSASISATLGKFLKDRQTHPSQPSDPIIIATKFDGAKMRPHAYSGAVPVQDKSIITKGGVRYFPLPLAAFVAQTSEASLRNWIDNRVKFDGKLIKTIQSLTNDIYVSEETVDRMKERFIKWPSNQPAGSVILGETDDHSGFLPVSDAARIVGVSRRTMWLWASQGKAPTNKFLDIIKCTTSDHFYIREKDTLELAKLVPRSGLQRGRRPQATSQPT